MNLLFNAESLRPPITGVGNYSYHLLEELMAQSLVDGVDSFTGTGWQSGQAQLAATGALRAAGGQDMPRGKIANTIAGLRSAVARVPGAQSVYDRLMARRFERHANKVPDALYHETNYILKPYRGPCITTVHDLSHLRFPEYHPRHVVDWLERSLAKSLARADHVITVSELVRGEVLEHYGLDPARVSAIYEGVEGAYQPRDAAATAPVLGRYGLNHGHYVLLVATLEPRKGIDVLLDAWQQLPRDLRLAYPLVMTGSSGWRNEQVQARIARGQEEGTVRHLGYVPAAYLPPLFSGAAVFSYPSVYEGFGLPVLDAMHSAVPVICRSGTSMAEFAQGNCLLCETGDAGELAGHLQALLEDPALRDVWGRRGRARAKHFSWARCARETAEIYRRFA